MHKVNCTKSGFTESEPPRRLLRLTLLRAGQTDEEGETAPPTMILPNRTVYTASQASSQAGGALTDWLSAHRRQQRNDSQ
jgi:hypothetical protein